MSQVFKAAALYFAMVFGAGFALGTARVLWLAPRVGERAAELIETPVMVAVVVFAARLIVRRLRLAGTLGARLGMGLIALSLLLACEFALVLPLRGMSFRGYFASLDPVTASAYYGALVLFALLPLFVPPVIGRDAGPLNRRHA